MRIYGKMRSIRKRALWYQYIQPAAVAMNRIDAVDLVVDLVDVNLDIDLVDVDLDVDLVDVDLVDILFESFFES